MLQSITDFMKAKEENGLLLIDPNTGSGKTYSACQAIYNYVHNTKNPKKVYFTTTLLKNLPIKELENCYNENKNSNFRKEVLVIKANVNFVKENLENANVPEEYKNEEYEYLLNLVKEATSKGFENKNPIYKAEIEKQLESAERAFRKHLKDIVSKIEGTHEEKKNKIRYDKRYKWIGEIYPTVFTDDYKVYLLSVKKLLTRNDTLIKRSYHFISADNLKNAIIFIDEFDATKKTIQDSLIEQVKNTENDYLEIVKELHSKLHDHIPTTTSYEPYRAYAKNKPNLDTIESLQKKADLIFEKYALNFNYKTENVDRKRAFLFFDGTFRSYLKNNCHYIRTVIDKENNKVSIFFETKCDYNKNKNTETDINIYSLLRDITSFLNAFAKFVERWASVYERDENERRKKNSKLSELFTNENAIKTICNNYIKDEHLNAILQDLVKSTTLRNRNDNNIDDIIGDVSFYNRGFKFFEFIDSDSHNEETKIHFIQQNDTPEKILLFMANYCKVIGLSATAKIDSVLSNYSLDYLENELKKNYIELSENAYKRLNDEQQKKWTLYKAGKIKVNVLSVDKDVENKTVKDRLKLIAEDSDVAQNMLTKLNNLDLSDKDNNKNYYLRRYCNVFSVIKEFIENDDIKSFLCLNMALPKTDNEKFGLNIFKDFSEQYCEVHDKEKLNIRVLESKNFETEKNSVLEDLAAGKKIFVFSSYQTIGAGQNLQYKLPDTEKDKIISLCCDRGDDKEKDFDAIYLGDVTNVITNFSEKKDLTELLTFLFEIRYLYENNEISPRELKELVEFGFKAYSKEKNCYNPVDIINTASARRKLTRDVIQAIGRLCRTNNKKENIYIYTDNDLLSKLDINCVKTDYMNPELKALFDFAKGCSQPLPSEKTKLENEACRKSELANHYIKAMLQRDWTDRSMQLWKELRKCVLKYPTASKEIFDTNDIVKNFYIPNYENKSVYHYAQRGDFQEIKINLFQDYSEFKKELDDDYMPMIVSEDSARLKKLFTYKGLKQFFEQRGFATEFGNEDFILCPVLFNNIYKGALGEVTGKFVLDKELNTEIKEITNPDYFEFFDFELKDGIYIDFKHWKTALLIGKESYIKHIANKLEKIGGKKAYVINILKEADYEIKQIGSIVEIPYLIDDNGTVNEKAIKKIAEDMINEK